MTIEEQIQPQPADFGKIQRLYQGPSEGWFEYPVRAHPHHTDYAGIVWHGSYLTWMEEARIECLRSLGIGYEDLVALGCDLPVVDLTLRYHQPLRMGMEAIVKVRIPDSDTIRLNCDYQIRSLDGRELYVTARVTLVAVDREQGKLMRQLPPAVKAALTKVTV